MFKKKLRLILCGLLAAVISVTSVGCSLVEHNYEKDYDQIIATVKPITFSTKVNDKEQKFTSEEVNIYKRQFIVQWNNSAQNYINANYTPEKAAETILDQLVNRELLIIEAKKMLSFGIINFTQADKNAVAKSVYDSIDAQITTLKNEVLSLHDDPTPEKNTDSTDENKSSSTYPVPPEETPDEDPAGAEEKWYPETGRFAVSGDVDKLSLDREVIRRLVDWLAGLVEKDNIASAKEKALFDKDLAKMRSLIAEGKEHKIYPLLYDYDYDENKAETGGTYIVKYLLGKNAYESRLLTVAQKYVESGVTVNATEVLATYNRLVEEQKRAYSVQADYHTAVTKADTNVVYNPDDNHFYVKHILLPFSDAQKAVLEAYKKENRWTKEEIEKFRDNLAEQIVAYPHVNGENDLSRPMSVNAVLGEVRSKMSRFANDPREAERLFDSLVYKYNTDPGMFGNAKGYAVRYKLPSGETETYMKEFADAAREMYDSLKVGEVYSKPVVTDYGVHIMYFAAKTKVGVKKIDEYQTPACYKTVADIIEEQLLSSKKSAAYSAWQQEKLSVYNDKSKEENPYVARYTDRYKDLYGA